MKAKSMSGMPNIKRVIWKPINWYPESPDQYEGDLPIPKEIRVVVHATAPGEVTFQVAAKLLGSSVRIDLIKGSKMRTVGTLPVSKVPAAFDLILSIYRAATGDSNPSMKHIKTVNWAKKMIGRPMMGYNGEILITGTTDENGIAEALLITDTEEEDLVLVWTHASNGWDAGPVNDDNAVEVGRTESCPMFRILLSQAPALANAILFVHRRTHEHDYEGPDCGL